MERKGGRDNVKQWKQERKVSGKMKKPPKKVRPSKVFIYALALAALGGGGYLIYDRMRRKKLQVADDAGAGASDTILINNYIPSSSLATKSAKGTDSFPLKRGSRGTRVTALQQGLARIIGTTAMNANGGIDGQFGPGTANALKLAGHGEIVDEPTFNKITGGAVAQIVFNPSDIALRLLRLYRAAQGKGVSLVLAILKEIRTVSEYSAVNEYYKRQALVSKTIVTDLLNYAFVGSESAKGQIKSKLLRMGLKVDSVGTWSLQGIRLYKDLKNIRYGICFVAKRCMLERLSINKVVIF